MPGDVCTYDKVYVPGFDWRKGNSQVHTHIAHFAEVGEHLVVGEGRHGHIVGIEHIVCPGIVVLYGEKEAAVPHPQFGACIHRRNSFPTYVGIGIVSGSESEEGIAIDRHHT